MRTARFFRPPARDALLIGDERISTVVEAGKGRARAGLPNPVRFSEDSGRGLLLSAWVNGAGPFTFALDTGAGATILSSRVAGEARVSVSSRHSVMIGGMSGAGSVAGQEVSVRSLALGEENNILPSSGLVIVTDRLAPGIDGVLDPAEAYWPLGFEIDMPRGELTAFDPRSNPLRRNQSLVSEEATVPWLFDGQSRRPFVMLEGRVRALLDTGSGFGLAVTEGAAVSLGILGNRGREYRDVRDIAGGQISAHKISPATVHLGNLVLRGVPTDLLPNARAGSPVLLGRNALRPFRLTFDPLNRLIKIIPD
ncbi:MAG TPA: aspartyl protease family protein [Pyrinomonadaceae bacterium]|nr:aspartyl protease family protein [Pyrinomonadaceae bacterium]